MTGPAPPAAADESMIVGIAVVFPVTLGPNTPKMAPCQTTLNPRTAGAESYDLAAFSSLVESMLVVQLIYGYVMKARNVT
jgi:hypothetical protein